MHNISPELLKLATPEELKLLDSTLQLEKSLLSPLDFMEYTYEDTVRYPHTEIVNQYVMAMIEWKLYKSGIGPAAFRTEDGRYLHPVTQEPALRRMQVSMSVRHGKSLYHSIHLPAWHMIKYPEKPLMLVSSSDDFARLWSKATRDKIIEHPEYGLSIDRDLSGATTWKLKGHQGQFHAAGVTGQITGHGAFGIVLDDLIKSSEEADSEAVRSSHLDLWDSTISKRLTKSKGEPGWVVIVSTRWHQQDLQGKLRTREPKHWFILNMPGLAFESVDEEGFSIDPETNQRDLLNRHPGEALCPAIASVEDHIITRETQPRWFNAMVQGMPAVEGGELVQYIPEYTLKGGVYTLLLQSGEVRTVPVEDCFRFSTMDLAATEKTTADWTVLSVWDVTPDKRLIWAGMERVRIRSDKHKDWTVEKYKQWGGAYVGIEKITFGLTLIQTFQESGEIPFMALKPDKDKVSRFLVATPLFSSDRFFAPKTAAWRPIADREIKEFPQSEHDDIVDTISYAAKALLSIPERVLKGNKPKTEADLFWDGLNKKKREPHEVLGLW